VRIGVGHTRWSLTSVHSSTLPPPIPPPTPTPTPTTLPTAPSMIFSTTVTLPLPQPLHLPLHLTPSLHSPIPILKTPHFNQNHSNPHSIQFLALSQPNSPTAHAFRARSLPYYKACGPMRSRAPRSRRLQRRLDPFLRRTRRRSFPGGNLRPQAAPS